MATFDAARTPLKDNTYARNLMVQFAVETFEFLMQNAHIWFEFPKDFLILHTYRKSTLLTEVVRKAILSMACLGRSEYKCYFKKYFQQMGYPDSFSYYLKLYPVVKDEEYFDNFLSWVAFLCTLTMLMYQKGYDFLAQARQCLSEYSDEYFYEVGGWPALFEHSGLMLQKYNDILNVIRKEVPNYIPKMIIASLINSIKAEERRERLYRNEWLFRTPKMTRADEISKKLSAKYRAGLTLDSKRVIPGFIVVLRNEFQDYEESQMKQSASSASNIHPVEVTKHYDVGEEDNMNTSTNGGKTCISEKVTDKTYQFIENNGSFSNATAESAMGGVATGMKPEPPEFEEMKSAFVVSERLLIKRAEAKRGRHERKRVIRIFSTTKQTEHISRNLTELFDKNIENGNYTELQDGVFKVCTQSCHENNDCSRFIVLDTSSEEEDEVNEISSYDTFISSYFESLSLSPSEDSAGTQCESAGQFSKSGTTQDKKEGKKRPAGSPVKNLSVGERSVAHLPQRNQSVASRLTETTPNPTSHIHEPEGGTVEEAKELSKNDEMQPLNPNNNTEEQEGLLLKKRRIEDPET